jgi:hypothetical protein
MSTVIIYMLLKGHIKDVKWSCVMSNWPGLGFLAGVEIKNISNVFLVFF